MSTERTPSDPDAAPTEVPSGSPASTETGSAIGAPRPRRFSLIRDFALADFITLGNAACGTASMFLCLDYVAFGDPRKLWVALALIPVAFVCDAADGTVARWRHRSSPYGGDLDSLADIVSFGVAPAVLAFTLGMRGLWDMAALIFFVCCGIGRLARFNATAEALTTDKGKVAYFEGTPIPISLLLVGLLAALFGMGMTGDALPFGQLTFPGGGRLHPIALAWVGVGSLMVSTIRIPKP